MYVYMDADACPVKDEIYRICGRHQLKVFVVTNRSMHVPLNPGVELVVVGRDLDAADDWIAEKIQEYDLCLTADIPLAHRCLQKNALVMDFRGEEFTHDSIGEAMASRELMKELREMGLVQGGPSAFAPKDRSAFLSQFHNLIERAKRLELKKRPLP